MATAPIVQLGIDKKTDFGLIGKETNIFEEPNLKSDVVILVTSFDQNTELGTYRLSCLLDVYSILLFSFVHSEYIYLFYWLFLLPY